MENFIGILLFSYVLGAGVFFIAGGHLISKGRHGEKILGARMFTFAIIWPIGLVLVASYGIFKLVKVIVAFYTKMVKLAWGSEGRTYGLFEF